MTLEQAIEQALASQDPDMFLREIPYARFLQLRGQVVAGHMEMVMPFAERLVGNAALPALHGGTLGALLETTSLAQLVWSRKSTKIPKTINLTVTYLRSAKAVDTYCSCEVVKVGRRVAHARAETWQDDRSKLIALSYGHFLISSEP